MDMSIEEDDYDSDATQVPFDDDYEDILDSSNLEEKNTPFINIQQKLHTNDNLSSINWLTPMKKNYINRQILSSSPMSVDGSPHCKRISNLQLKRNYDSSNVEAHISKDVVSSSNDESDEDSEHTRNGFADSDRASPLSFTSDRTSISPPEQLTNDYGRQSVVVDETIIDEMDIDTPMKPSEVSEIIDSEQLPKDIDSDATQVPSDDDDDDILDCSYFEEEKRTPFTNIHQKSLINNNLSSINFLTPRRKSFLNGKTSSSSPMNIDRSPYNTKIYNLSLEQNYDLSNIEVSKSKDVIIISSSDESEVEDLESTRKGLIGSDPASPFSFTSDRKSISLLEEMNTDDHCRQSSVVNESVIEVIDTDTPMKSTQTTEIIDLEKLPNSKDKLNDSQVARLEEYERCLDERSCILKPVEESSIENRLNFLSSLSDHTYNMKCDPVADYYKLHYRTAKTSLARQLFYIYNEMVFDNKLPQDMPLKWSDKLMAACGITTTKYERHPDGHTSYFAYITLSKKILTTAERLRDTIAHEMCHAAVWLINHSTDSHGCIWKTWALRLNLTLAEMPTIVRCHNYQVNYRYVYKCQDCGYRIGRSRPSEKILLRCICGYCGGRFKEITAPVGNGKK